MLVQNIIFDRDGVINEVVMRAGKVSSPRAMDEFVIRGDFEEFARTLAAFAVGKFVVSNQPDVSRQLLAPEHLRAMTGQLQRFGFKEIVYCTHDDHHQCHCRKPKPGMVSDLIDKYSLNVSTTILIGDSKKDILAGQAAGLKTVYLRGPYNQQPGCSPEFIVDALVELLGIITLNGSRAAR